MGRIKKDFYVAEPNAVSDVLSARNVDIIRLQLSSRNPHKFIIAQVSSGERVQANLNLGKYPNRQQQGIAHVIGMGFKPLSSIICDSDVWLVCAANALSLAKQWESCAVTASDVTAEDLPSHVQAAPMPAGLPAVPFGDVPAAYAFTLPPEVWASLAEA